MRINSVSQSNAIQLSQSNVSGNSNRESVIQRKIQALQKQLSTLESKSEEELSESEIAKKQEIQQQIVQLQQELQSIRAEETEQEEASTVSQKEVDGQMRTQVKEDGLGDYIDEYA
ncbi:MAG: FlxA-like family protein [Bacillota bacterium]|nr:FlxA-like family protein [Bacillota bacterium]